MVNRLKVRFIIVFLTAALVIPVGYLVIRYEHQKKIDLAMENKQIIEDVAQDFDKYHTDYLNAVEQQKEQNKQKMIEDKMAYEFLLSEQDKIIEEHTKQVAVTDSSNLSSGSGTTIKGSPTSTSGSSQPLPKPTTTRKTKAS
jgi:maltodextrin utilization protein YvdJ